jgi:hypothetical protein
LFIYINHILDWKIQISSKEESKWVYLICNECDDEFLFLIIAGELNISNIHFRYDDDCTCNLVKVSSDGFVFLNECTISQQKSYILTESCFFLERGIIMAFTTTFFNMSLETSIFFGGAQNFTIYNCSFGYLNYTTGAVHSLILNSNANQNTEFVTIYYTVFYKIIIDDNSNNSLIDAVIFKTDGYIV